MPHAVVLYLITITAAAFLAQVAVELFSTPIREIVRLRRTALERILFFRGISLPRPRELAVSSREIRAYDQAVKNLREAQRSFADLGRQFFALAESEPAIRFLMVLFGLDLLQAGHELIKLSDVYAAATIDSEELRRAIERALEATSTALAASRRHSGNDLTKIRLEPMYLRKALSRLKRHRPLAQPRVISVYTSRPAPSPRHLRQQNAKADRLHQGVPIRRQAPTKSRA